jgi:hypothetical protein
MAAARNPIEAEVMAAFQELVDASTALDATRYFDCIDTEKFSGLSADGKVWHSFRDLEKVIAGGFPMIEKIVSLQFANVKVTLLNSSTAILVNEFKQTLRLKDDSVIHQAGGGAQVWCKSGGPWKLVSISASDASARDGAVF